MTHLGEKETEREGEGEREMTLQLPYQFKSWNHTPPPRDLIQPYLHFNEGCLTFTYTPHLSRSS